MKEKEKMEDGNIFIIERIFRITKTNNTIDLSGSASIVNKEASEKFFENEVYYVTFTTTTNGKTREYSLFLSPSETIPKNEINNLRRALDIQISGDGMQFSIDYFSTDFTIQFDQKNSICIDNSEVKNGFVSFKSYTPKIETRKRKFKRLQNKRTF